ncbi:hypothetical protein [Saccharopolyspora pogona]|uniref:hypothetical protein n=1 Tax=Saccharopolyspora pogona TaxID=333966 RepID=UPI001CC26BD5|nr:hypothetical protein [Saccharopolyspora pogona]
MSDVDILGQRRQNGDVQLPAAHRAHLVDRAARPVDVLEDAASRFDERLAVGAEHQLAAGAVEQLHPGCRSRPRIACDSEGCAM